MRVYSFCDEFNQYRRELRKVERKKGGKVRYRKMLLPRLSRKSRGDISEKPRQVAWANSMG